MRGKDHFFLKLGVQVERAGRLAPEPLHRGRRRPVQELSPVRERGAGRHRARVGQRQPPAARVVRHDDGVLNGLHLALQQAVRRELLLLRQVEIRLRRERRVLDRLHAGPDERVARLDRARGGERAEAELEPGDGRGHLLDHAQADEVGASERLRGGGEVEPVVLLLVAGFQRVRQAAGDQPSAVEEHRQPAPGEERILGVEPVQVVGQYPQYRPEPEQAHPGGLLRRAGERLPGRLRRSGQAAEQQVLDGRRQLVERGAELRSVGGGGQHGVTRPRLRHRRSQPRQARSARRARPGPLRGSASGRTGGTW